MNVDDSKNPSLAKVLEAGSFEKAEKEMAHNFANPSKEVVKAWSEGLAQAARLKGVADIEPKVKEETPKEILIRLGATIHDGSNPEGDVNGELGARAAYDAFLVEYDGLLKRIFESKELLIDADLVDMITDEMHEKLDTALTEYYDKTSSDGLNVDDIDDADEA